MASTAADLKSGVILMHMRGRPEDWRHLPSMAGDELLALVKRDLAGCSKSAMNAGIARESIVLDAGFGFGKTFDENYPLLARFSELHALGFPLLAGTSRKSFIGHTLGFDGQASATIKQDRLYGSIASITAAVLQGAHSVRVRDRRPALDSVKGADKMPA